jgi:hypothetical protein
MSNFVKNILRMLGKINCFSRHTQATENNESLVNIPNRPQDNLITAGNAGSSSRQESRSTTREKSSNTALELVRLLFLTMFPPANKSCRPYRHLLLMTGPPFDVQNEQTMQGANPKQSSQARVESMWNTFEKERNFNKKVQQTSHE